MNDFEQAGIIFLDGWKRLKLVIDGKEYFLTQKDIHRAMSKSNFQVPIYQLAKQKKRIEDTKKQSEIPKPIRGLPSFSVIFSEASGEAPK
jgi:hypothetical protein